ncbi:MAG: pyruvate kinase, partial [Acholeplasmataceae bacterium]
TLAKNSHILRDRRGINVPNAKLNLPFISEHDLADIDFACRFNVDYIAASFVRRKEDVLEIKEILKKAGREYIIVIAKIESQEAISNIDEILEVADGIMVARGDLGVEIFPEDLPHVQKQIVLKCQQQGKIVIIATQMLESMIFNPRPTRAEVSDVANAVYEGADATMLSGEMAVGKYPIESVEYMAKINHRSQHYIDHLGFITNTPVAPDDILEAIGYATAQTTLHYPVKAILSYGHSQSKTISKYRPIAPIIAMVDEAHKATTLSCYYGVFPVLNEQELQLKYRQLGIDQGDTILVARRGQIQFIRI